MRVWHPYRPGCCNLPDEQHRPDERKRSRAGRKDYHSKRGNRSKHRYIVGIDGEGYDTPEGEHLYVYLCASDGAGRIVSEAFNPKGLSTDECACMLLAIPKRALCFGFMFGYDITKIVENLGELERYRLMRPELRARRRGKLTWRKRVKGFDFFAGSLSLKDESRSVHVWDCFKFFGQSFVKALTAWDVGTPEERERIAEMKLQRGDFANVDINEIRKYCADECRLLAVLMRKVIDAHEKAGIPLRRFEGAGSSAASLLQKHSVDRFRERKRAKVDVDLYSRQAFFGGRFEHSYIGSRPGPVHGYDIRSAYPAAMQCLPCLKCGRWRFTRRINSVQSARAALCYLTIEKASEKARSRIAWQPLPCRTEDGSIVFGTGFSGWFHGVEALAALRWPGVKFHHAWVYDTDCKHRPFDWVENTYKERVRWGSTGPGLTLKNALNASYGKLAQMIGNAPFRCLLWAGAITAFIRARILSTLAPDAWHIFAVATDGIQSGKDLHIGTDEKILGSWEPKESDGMIFVKPGLYWSPADDTDKFRARGIGRREAWQHREAIAEALERWDGKDFEYGVTVKSRRFFGAKQSLYAMSHCRECGRSYPGADKCPDGHLPAKTDVKHLEAPDGHAAYGRWVERDIAINFTPLPKREAVMGKRLRVRDMGGSESLPYNGTTTPEGVILRELRENELEQPDWDEDL